MRDNNSDNSHSSSFFFVVFFVIMVTFSLIYATIVISPIRALTALDIFFMLRSFYTYHPIGQVRRKQGIRNE